MSSQLNFDFIRDEQKSNIVDWIETQIFKDPQNLNHSDLK